MKLNYKTVKTYDRQSIVKMANWLDVVNVNWTISGRGGMTRLFYQFPDFPEFEFDPVYYDLIIEKYRYSIDNFFVDVLNLLEQDVEWILENLPEKFENPYFKKYKKIYFKINWLLKDGKN